MSVKDVKTQKVVIDKKFRKNAFNELINCKEHGKYLDMLLEKAMVKIMGDPDNMNIDVESYEEIRSIADNLETLNFDPED